MPRGDSASRSWVTHKSRCGVRFPKNRYAPIVHRRIVIEHCYYQTLTEAARVGMGNIEQIA